MTTTIDARTIPLEDIHESPLNPRKHFEQLDELAASIKEKGILQPILVRPHQDPKRAGVMSYQLVAGARRVRASKLAKLTQIPAIVRTMSDAEALETQVIENNQRANVHPLEEADGFLLLAKKHGHTAETIAAKIGRSAGYVYQRMRLGELGAKGREAFLDGTLSAAAALVLARIPHVALQDKALAELKQWNRHEEDEPISPSQARRLVRDKFMLRLADAPFDTKDAKLCSDAGACSSCPKRTGAQTELFADFDKEDLCTDPTCYAEKRDVAFKLRAEAAKAAGQKVLTKAEVKEVFAANGAPLYNSGFVELSGTEWDAGSGKARSWKDRLGKDCPPIILAQDPTGGVHELVDKKAALAICKKGEKAKASETKKNQAATSHAAKDRIERDTEDRLRELVIGKIVAAAEKNGIKAAPWRMLLVDLLVDHGDQVAQRRGLADGAALEKLVGKMTAAQLQALFVDLSCATWDAPLEDLAKAYGVDWAKLKKEATAEVKAKAEKKGKAA